MMKISGDLSNVGGYIGAVGGVLNAIEDPRFKGNFTGHLMGKMRKVFMVDAKAAHMAGTDNLAHVFEWGPQSPSGVSMRTPGNIPLFRLTKSGTREQRFLSYEFLPSTKPVPLPDPAKYGFSEAKLPLLSRHVFTMKALIMETQSSVSISPVMAKKLFIPDADHPRGYYMSSKTQNINPGGEGSTGGFATYWTMWFESRAQGIVNEEQHLAEQVIKATGQKVIRHMAGTKVAGKAVGGRFAAGKPVTVGYVDAVKRNAELEAANDFERVWDEDEAWDEAF